MRTIKTTTMSILAAGLLAGTAVGVAAQDEDPSGAPAAFTGSFTTQFDLIDEGTWTEADGLVRITDSVFQTSMVASDPRLTGSATITNSVVFEPAGDGPPFNGLNVSINELTNDGGSWLGRATGFEDVELGVSIAAIIFEGRGGYEGLTAYALVDTLVDPWEFQGTIFPAAMPQIVEPDATEQERTAR